MRAAGGVNAAWLPGHAKGKGSANRPISEHELQLAKHQIPVLASGMPVLHDALSGQIEHPAQGIVIGKAGFVFGDLSELAVKALNDVRRVYDFPNLRRVFIKGAQNLPIFLPTLHAGGVLTTPFFSKLEKRILRLIQSNSGVDFFQVSRHLFDILPTDVSGGGSNLMDDAALETAVGIHGLDSLHHAAQTVRAKQINIHNSPTFEVVQHIQPHMSRLASAKRELSGSAYPLG